MGDVQRLLSIQKLPEVKLLNINNIGQSKSKFPYISSNVWKKIFLIQRTGVLKLVNRYFFLRGSCIPAIFINKYIYIYNGKKWIQKYVTRWVVGFKIGDFTWNRKIALYKAKQTKKKK